MSAINKIIVLGGGLSGNTVAAVLAHTLAKTEIKLVLLDYDKTPDSCDLWRENHSAEALLPQTQVLHERLGLDEKKILARTDGLFNLGTQYCSWKEKTSIGFQPYKNAGVNFHGIEFQHYYKKLNSSGSLSSYENYSISAAAALSNKFVHPVDDNNSILSTLSYGLSLARKPYSEMYRHLANYFGVEIITGEYKGLTFDTEGAIQEITIGDKKVDGDLFIDCSENDSLLLGKAMNVESIDWNDYFISDRCITFTTPHSENLPSCLTLQSTDKCLVKTVPLASSNVVSWIYNSECLADHEALEKIANNSALVQKLQHGCKAQLWVKNVIAFGDAAVTLEPLGFTGQDLLYENLSVFLNLLPTHSDFTENAKEYNRITSETYGHIRDYQSSHYLLHSGTAKLRYWNPDHINSISPELAHRIALFKLRGSLFFHDKEMIPPAMWITLFFALGISPKHYDPLADGMNSTELEENLHKIRSIVSSTVERMPPISDYREHYLRGRKS